MGRSRKNRKRRQRPAEQPKGKIRCDGNDIARYDHSVCLTRQERKPGNCLGCARFRG